jgi:hypothetical protein
MENYYIFFTQLFHKVEANDYHLEKIFDYEKVLEILNNFNYEYERFESFIITNDQFLSNKYLLAINEEEFKSLCQLEYNEKQVRLSNKLLYQKSSNQKNYTLFFSNHIAIEIFDMYFKVKSDEIISASSTFDYEPSDTVYDDEGYEIGYRDDYHTYTGLDDNVNFFYFETPGRYRTADSFSDIFYLKKIGIAKISAINDFFNVDILKIGNDETPDINWELKEDLLKYYDKKSCCRFLISLELLKEIKSYDDPYELFINTSTKLDKNHYIEHHANSIFFEKEIDNDENEERKNNDKNENDNYNRNNWLKDATGSVDPDAMNTTYWNID